MFTHAQEFCLGSLAAVGMSVGMSCKAGSWQGPTSCSPFPGKAALWKMASLTSAHSPLTSSLPSISPFIPHLMLQLTPHTSAHILNFTSPPKSHLTFQLTLQTSPSPSKLALNLTPHLKLHLTSHLVTSHITSRLTSHIISYTSDFTCCHPNSAPATVHRNFFNLSSFWSVFSTKMVSKDYFFFH